MNVRHNRLKALIRTNLTRRDGNITNRSTRTEEDCPLWHYFCATIIQPCLSYINFSVSNELGFVHG